MNTGIITAMLESVSRNEWGEFLDKQKATSSELLELSDMLTSRAVLFAELAKYLDYRGGAGLGDSGHEIAMKKAQKRRRKVRKALGYSYP